MYEQEEIIDDNFIDEIEKILSKYDDNETKETQYETVDMSGFDEIHEVLEEIHQLESEMELDNNEQDVACSDDNQSFNEDDHSDKVGTIIFIDLISRLYCFYDLHIF